MRTILAIALLLSASCKGSGPREGTARTNRSFATDVAADDSRVVARVNGKPVLADCVEREAAAKGLTREDALEECIDFELLAQEAEERGYVGDEAVQETGKRETVRALTQGEFTLREASDVSLDLARRYWEQGLGELPQGHPLRVPGKDVLNVPELRTTYYCRESLAADAGAAEAAVARVKMQTFARALKSRGKIDTETFKRLCAENTGDEEAPRRGGMQHSPLFVVWIGEPENNRQPTPDEKVVDSTYSEAAYSVPDEGAASAPVRTSWGYDVVFVADITPEVTTTFEESLPDIRKRLYADPMVRRFMFLRWSNEMGRASGAEVRAYFDRVPHEEDSLESRLSP